MLVSIVDILFLSNQLEEEVIRCCCLPHLHSCLFYITYNPCSLTSPFIRSNLILTHCHCRLFVISYAIASSWHGHVNWLICIHGSYGTVMSVLTFVRDACHYDSDDHHPTYHRCTVSNHQIATATDHTPCPQCLWGIVLPKFVRSEGCKRWG